MTGVVVISGGRDDLLRQCLMTLRAGAIAPFHVVLVADGWTPSSDIRMFVDETIRLPGASGIPKLWNVGLRRLYSLKHIDLMLVQNDDTWLPTAWDANFDLVFDDDRVMCACAVDRGVGQTLFPDVVPWDRKAAWASLPAAAGEADAFYDLGKLDGDGFAGFELDWPRALKAKSVPHFLPARMNGASFMLRRDVLSTIGLFDENLVAPGTFEDHDYWLRLLLFYGPQAMGTATRVFMHHWRSATLSALPRRWADGEIARNAGYFRNKWFKDAAVHALWDWFGTPPSDPSGQREANATPWNQPLPALPLAAAALAGAKDPRAVGPTLL